MDSRAQAEGVKRAPSAYRQGDSFDSIMPSQVFPSQHTEWAVHLNLPQIALEAMET